MAAPTATAPRQGTKIARVIELLQRDQGAKLDELIAATGWLPHTARAALTGLRHRGYDVRLGAWRERTRLGLPRPRAPRTGFVIAMRSSGSVGAAAEGQFGRRPARRRPSAPAVSTRTTPRRRRMALALRVESAARRRTGNGRAVGSPRGLA